MTLHKPSIDRIKEAEDIGKYMLDMFQRLVEAAEEAGSESSEMVASFIREEDEFEIGSYVPTLILTIQKVVPEPEAADDSTN